MSLCRRSAGLTALGTQVPLDLINHEDSRLLQVSVHLVVHQAEERGVKPVDTEFSSYVSQFLISPLSYTRLYYRGQGLPL